MNQYVGPVVRREISIFDLDRTITRSGTWSPLLLFMARNRGFWRLALIPALLLAMAAYKCGLFGRRKLKEIMHASMIGRSVPSASLSGLVDRFVDDLIADGIYVQAKSLIKAEQATGRTVMIATASNRFYATSIAKRLGVNHLVATGSRYAGDNLTCRVEGENCYGAGKRRMVEDYLIHAGFERALTHIRFYSDDLSDLPTFLWSDEPVAVNPSRKLQWHAMRHGWRVLDWRLYPDAMDAGTRPGPDAALGAPAM